MAASAHPPVSQDRSDNYDPVQVESAALIAANGMLLEIIKVVTRSEPKWWTSYKTGEDKKDLSIVEQISERCKTLLVLLEHPEKLCPGTTGPK